MLTDKIADGHSKTVVGLFSSFAEAQEVAEDLKQRGFSHEDVSVVANDSTGEHSSALGAHTGEHVSDAASGAGTGAAIGGAAGLALGLAALVIPGVGPIIAGGALATALTGAGIGAAAGGLIGGLTHMGVPENDAHYYSEGVKGGGSLVVVKTSADRADMAASILERSGAENVDERDDDAAMTGSVPAASKVGVYGSGLTAPGLTTAGMNAPGMDVPGMTTGGYDAESRTHFQGGAYPATSTYDSESPAYRYGSGLASDPRYQGKDWSAIEHDVRRDWETRGEGAWDEVKDSVRHAWDKVTGHR